MQEKNLSQYFEEESIDWKAYVFKLVRFWYIFPITALVSLIICFFVIKTKTPIYSIGSKIIVENEQSLMDPNVILQNATNPFSLGDYKINNEIEILNSYDLAKRTALKLDFSVSYFIRDSYRDIELYNEAPFKIWYDSTHVQPVNVKFFLERISDNQYHIWSEGEDVGLYLFNKDAVQFENPFFNFQDTIAEGEIVENELLKFKVLNFNMQTNELYKFSFRSISSVIDEFRHFYAENVKY